MNATLKRRMWTVAIVHFVLSLCALSMVLSAGGAREGEFWRTIFFSLQPQLLFLIILPFGLTWFSALVSSLITCLCFAWLYVKLVGWLNHFPVLGRKVF
jgi:hypothetical protein